MKRLLNTKLKKKKKQTIEGDERHNWKLFLESGKIGFNAKNFGIVSAVNI